MTMSKAERLAAKITEGIMTGHDHPNLQHELDRMNAAAHLRALDASHQRLLEVLEQAATGGGDYASEEKKLAAIKQARALS